jgi:hypothetical protein
MDLDRFSLPLLGTIHRQVLSISAQDWWVVQVIVNIDCTLQIEKTTLRPPKRAVSQNEITHVSSRTTHSCNLEQIKIYVQYEIIKKEKKLKGHGRIILTKV